MILDTRETLLGTHKHIELLFRVQLGPGGRDDGCRHLPGAAVVPVPGHVPVGSGSGGSYTGAWTGGAYTGECGGVKY